MATATCSKRRTGTQVELSEQEALAAGGAGAEYQKEIPTEQARGMPEGSQDRGIGKLLLGAAAAGLTLYLMRGVIKKVSGKVTGKGGKKDKKGGNKIDKKDPQCIEDIFPYCEKSPGDSKTRCFKPVFTLKMRFRPKPGLGKRNAPLSLQYPSQPQWSTGDPKPPNL
ncbi:hypothetical protein DIPPA_28677 [Diplonema papillatum]|nr:hypothetical protein DIPPA_28677 [Diplonema papillatum]